MKKLAIVRFKPKPECFIEFVEALKEHSRERHLLQEFNYADRHTIFMTGDLVED